MEHPPRMAPQPGSNLLTQAGVFAGLNPAALADVAAGASSVVLPAGRSFFVQGDTARAFYVLAAGRVRISQLTAEGHQVTLRYIGAGQMFGAVPMFAGGPYPASAVAVLPSTAARWDLVLARRLAERHPTILANALAIVGRRLHEMQNRYRELATERVERRLARVVLQLARPGDGADPGREIDFPISRQDIAEMAGATLHTVSRILSGWEQRGLLESHRMRVRVAQPAALQAIADDLPERPAARD
jgi:CRP-like cAMP-binding protein